MRRLGLPARSALTRQGVLRCALGIAVFTAAFAIRVHGISHHFALLGDQMRDWQIALRPFRELPLVGPPTHVGGYTVGPAFYWILWLIRVTIGPFFFNLPHAGGIGQAALQSAADALLLVAIWKRAGSLWLALAAIVVLVTAPFDLALAPVIWNPVVGEILAKVATALVLLGWPRASLVRTGIVAAIAWCAVHAYTGAVFVAIGVFAALLVQPILREGRRATRYAVVIAAVVLLLQVPYLVHAMTTTSTQTGMGAVRDSIGRVLSGSDPTRFSISASGYASAVNRIEAGPWSIPAFGALLVTGGVLFAVGYRRDSELLAVILLPQVLAVVGYGFWMAGLDTYYYLSLTPAAVLTMLMGLTVWLPRRAAQGFAIGLLLVALTGTPARLRAARASDMPQYDALVKGSRAIVSLHQPMRVVTASFPLPPTGDPSYLFRILGGRIDRRSPWVATIQPDGRVVYRRVAASR